MLYSDNLLPLIFLILLINYISCFESIFLNASYSRRRSSKGGVVAKKAALGESPYSVSLQRSVLREHFCSGTAIGDNSVLTSGFCCSKIKLHEMKYYAVLGSVKTLDPIGSRHEVKNYVVHPMYKTRAHGYDIGVVIVWNKILPTDFVSFIPISTDKIVEEGKRCQFASWGDKKVDEENLSLLLYTIELMDSESCMDLWDQIDSDLMFCAGYGSLGDCVGWGGGSLVCDGVLFGIDCYGMSDCELEENSLFHNVGSVSDWIKKFQSNHTMLTSSSDYLCNNINMYLLFTILLFE